VILFINLAGGRFADLQMDELKARLGTEAIFCSRFPTRRSAAFQVFGIILLFYQLFYI